MCVWNGQRGSCNRCALTVCTCQIRGHSGGTRSTVLQQATPSFCAHCLRVNAPMLLCVCWTIVFCPGVHEGHFLAPQLVALTGPRNPVLLVFGPLPPECPWIGTHLHDSFQHFMISLFGVVDVHIAADGRLGLRHFRGWRAGGIIFGKVLHMLPAVGAVRTRAAMQRSAHHMPSASPMESRRTPQHRRHRPHPEGLGPPIDSLFPVQSSCTPSRV